MAQVFYVALAVVLLACTLTTGEVSAQGITVSPANPTIAVGQTQQFTVTGVGRATAVDMGDFHSCALLEDGSVRCWGANESGQLGDGNTTDSSAPVAVTGITGAAEVAAGFFHTCARFPSGAVQCWGRNNAGQVGDSPPLPEAVTTPVPVPGITATAITSGGYHTCALLGDRSVRCWGGNNLGQLGNGTSDPPPPPGVDPEAPRSSNPVRGPQDPMAVSGINSAVAISAGGLFTCALLQDGTIRCWGDNTYGQLGDGAAIPPRPTRSFSSTPVTVIGLTTPAVAIDAGNFHMCAVFQGGEVRCWGRNDDGRLGNGTSGQSSGAADSSTPTTVPATPAVPDFAAAALGPGAEHVCAVLADGRVSCWGDNNWGQLGNETPENPAVCCAFAPARPATGISTAIDASSGAEHTCVLLRDGTVWCWGNNKFGRVGVPLTDPRTRECPGSTSCAFAPVQVDGLGGGAVTWESSDPTVATIDAGNGLATAQGSGSTTITARSGARSGSTTLTVVARPTLTVIPEGTGEGTVTSTPAGIDCGATCSAAYDSGTIVTLTATPAGDSTFTGWSGGGCASTNPCTITLTANTTVIATFSAPRPTLTVTPQGTGAGTVTSTPAGIDCGATCSAAYDSGTVVTLTATPDADSTFVGWTGGDSPPGGQTTTVNFDTPPPPGHMNGVFQGIDFGTGQWQWSGPYNVDPTNHIYFADSTGMGRSFQFSPGPRVLNGLRVYSISPGTLTLSDDAGQTLTRAVTTGSLQAVATGWTRPSTTATVSFTNGWDLGVDDITYSTVSGGGCAGTGPCTVTLTANTTVFATFTIQQP
jgi:alpha-tubulin suppressor-like RCC1 family protein